MNHVIFGKTMENVRKHSSIKLVTTESEKKYLAPEPNFDTKKFLTIEMRPIDYRNEKNPNTNE